MRSYSGFMTRHIRGLSEFAFGAAEPTRSIFTVFGV
jgi:hypothetical protein